MRSGEAGFTLPEVLVTVTLAGIVIAVLGAAVLLVLRVSDPTAAAIDTTAGVRLAGHYWVRDVEAAHLVNPSGRRCGGAATVTFTAGADTGRIVSWRLTGSGALERTECDTERVLHAVTLLADLRPQRTVARCDGEPCHQDVRPRRVSLRLALGGGEELELTGTRRLP